MSSWPHNIIIHDNLNIKAYLKGRWEYWPLYDFETMFDLGVMSLTAVMWEDCWGSRSWADAQGQTSQQPGEVWIWNLCYKRLKSLRPSDTIWHHGTLLDLEQALVCLLIQWNLSNDHLYNKIYFLWFIQQCVLMNTEGTNLLLITISAFWSSSRWPLAT